MRTLLAPTAACAALLFCTPALGQIVIDNTLPGTYMDISGTGTPPRPDRRR